MDIPITKKTVPLKQYDKNSIVDVVLIGAGIMSSTLGVFLAILEPSWIIHIYERLQQPAQESSNAWNNAGTGHAAFCELNYTEYDQQSDSINIKKAISINTAFELSLQFWAYLTQNKILNNPKSFINNIPHMSFVWGENNISFLKKRFQALKKHFLFKSIIYSEDPKQIHTWIPLMMNGRNIQQKVAATRTEMGTDVNFGEITQQLLMYLQNKSNFQIYFQHHAECIHRVNNKTWAIKITDLQNKHNICINAHHIFIGGGGQSLNLLQTSGIPEIQGYAGFPVGGQFLITHNKTIINQHSAKVYGKASLHMPPMSVPHVDTRILNKNKILLFGPFATCSSKFLKYGSWIDLFKSLNKDNILPIIQAGIDNTDLIKYLFNQLIMSNKNRISALKKFYPLANSKDWSLIQAGQRVQIIKRNYKNRGILQFGTEIITHNKTLSALLGASPGASIATSISIKILYAMFYNQMIGHAWQSKLKEMVPSYTMTNQLQHHSNNFINHNKNTKKYTRDTLNLLSTN